MMFHEALEQRILRIRLPQWAEGAYLELPLLADGGFHGPWVTLHDPNVPPFDTKILISQFIGDTEARYEAAGVPREAPR